MRIFLVAVLLLSVGDLSAQRRREFTVDRVEKGREQYAGACSACHGLSGGGGRGPSLVDGLSARRSSDQELYDSIRDGVAGSEMPPFPFPEDELWNLVAFLRSLSAPASEVAVDGDPRAGADLYHGDARCGECHKIRGSGGFLGPDLTNIGAARRFDQLRESLLSPNKLMTDGFEAVLLKRGAGAGVKAIAKNRTNQSAQVIDVDGRLHLLRKQDLGRIEVFEQSWMPTDYGKRFSEKQIDDLLAFLAAQTIRPVERKR